MRLQSKILLLVVGPLLFQISLLFFLTGLLRQAESDLKIRIKAAEIQSLANKLQSDVSSCFLYAFMSGARDSEMIARRSDKLIAEIKTLTPRLCSNLQDCGYKQEDVDHIKVSIDRAVALGEEIKVDDPTSRGREARLVFVIETTQLVQSLINQVNKVSLYAQGLVPQTSSTAQSSQNVVIFLYAAVIADLLVAFLLAALTINNIVKRINVVNQNVINLAHDKPLRPAVGGKDEITDLDDAFRDMAASLADSIQKQNALVENTVDVLCSINKAGKFLKVSGAARKNWGYDPEDLVGRLASSIIAEDDREMIVAKCRDAKMSTAPVFCETRIIKSSHERSEFRWSIMWSEQDSSFFCVVRDVNRENELVRMKQALLDTAAHDLRAPLTAITTTLNNLSLGVFGPISDLAKERLARSEELARRLIRLVSDFLDHEKLSSGKITYTKAAVQLSSLLEEAIGEMRPLAEQKGILIQLESVSISLELDYDRVLQVIANVLSNAIRFSPPKSFIYVRSFATAAYVEIQVIDSGPGVAEEHKKMIFLRYTQAHSEDKSGSGLGLAISRAIVEAHGGTMGVADAVGGGSVFWVRFETYNSDTPP